MVYQPDADDRQAEETGIAAESKPLEPAIGQSDAVSSFDPFPFLFVGLISVISVIACVGILIRNRMAH